jgi:hypothetical protein
LLRKSINEQTLLGIMSRMPPSDWKQLNHWENEAELEAWRLATGGAWKPAIDNQHKPLETKPAEPARLATNQEIP